jgi:beta-glucosidase
MEMVSTHYYDQGRGLVESNRLDPKLVDESVKNILRVKFRLGLFDGRQAPAASSAPAADSLDFARRLAVRSLVLLKNEGALPLARQAGKVAVIGPLADSPADQVGTWAMDADLRAVVTPLNALRQVLGAERVLAAPGLSNSRYISHAWFADAVNAARAADTVLLFLGEEAALSGEASSRASLDLPGAQEELAAEVAGAGKPVVLVVMAGRPLTFHAAAAHANAVLYAWHPGSMGGPAIADVLVGNEAPSGKLPVTFPRTVGQVPLYYSHLNTGRPPAESNKFTSKYLDVPWTPEYPFGFGLSYARFEYSDLRVTAQRVAMNGNVKISAEIANTGRFAGEEVVQLYTHQIAGRLARPVRELRAFRRVRLEPGQHRTVEFTLPAADLAYYDESGHLAADPGRFEVWIAADSASGLKGAFDLAK